MKKLFNKLVGFMLAVVMVLGMSTVTFAAENPDSYSVDSYKNWILTSQLDSSSADRAQFFSEFEALTPTQQQLFVSYLNDEDLMKSVVTSFLQSKEPQVYADGNITVEEVTDFDSPNTLATYSTKATHTRTIQFFGIDVVEVSNYVEYTHNGSSILGVTRGGMITGKNFVPFLGISYSNDSLYVQSNRAYHVSDLTCEFLYEGSGIVYGSAEYGVYGTPSGTVGYWVTPY